MDRSPAGATPRTPFPLAHAAELVQHTRMVINKVTPNCNLSCKYCSAVASKPDGTVERVSDEALRRAVQLFVGGTHEHAIEWLFHGGEPLLLPVDWYRATMTMIEEAARDNPHLQRLAYGMQSNAVALKQEHLDLFVEKRVIVSSSLDGTPEIHDLMRGRGQTVLRNIRRLAEAGVGGGVITILTPTNIDHVDEILDFFAQNGVHGVKLNTLCCVGRGSAEQTVTGKQYARAMVACLQRMARTGSPEPLNNDLVSMLGAFLFGRSDQVPDRQNCYSYHCSGGRFFFGVEHDGDVYPCGRAADTKTFSLFNLLDERYDPQRVDRVLRDLHHKDAWFVRCFNCASRRICAFGCPAFEAGNLAEREIQCSFTRELYQFFIHNPELLGRVQRVLEEAFSGPGEETPGFALDRGQEATNER
jgi:uncharacterized protein